MSTASKIESLLLAAGEPLSLGRLAKLTGEKKEKLKEILRSLEEKYSLASGSGIILARVEDNYRFLTNPGAAALVASLLREDLNAELTEPGLEALAIIAYRGPATRPEIEQVRGVNCVLILRNLLLRGLVEKIGGEQEILPKYRITHEFLRFLGVSKAQDLPDYEKLSRDKTLDQITSGL